MFDFTIEGYVEKLDLKEFLKFLNSKVGNYFEQTMNAFYIEIKILSWSDQCSMCIVKNFRHTALEVPV